MYSILCIILYYTKTTEDPTGIIYRKDIEVILSQVTRQNSKHQEQHMIDQIKKMQYDLFI